VLRIIAIVAAAAAIVDIHCTSSSGSGVWSTKKIQIGKTPLQENGRKECRVSVAVSGVDIVCFDARSYSSGTRRLPGKTSRRRC